MAGSIRPARWNARTPATIEPAASTTAPTHTRGTRLVKGRTVLRPVTAVAIARANSAGMIPVSCRRGRTPSAVTAGAVGRAGGRFATRVAIRYLLVGSRSSRPSARYRPAFAPFADINGSHPACRTRDVPPEASSLNTAAEGCSARSSRASAQYPRNHRACPPLDTGDRISPNGVLPQARLSARAEPLPPVAISRRRGRAVMAQYRGAYQRNIATHTPRSASSLPQRAAWITRRRRMACSSAALESPGAAPIHRVASPLAAALQHD